MKMSRPELLGFASHGVLALVVASVIAFGLTLAGNQRWDIQWVYALSISILTWLLIDLSRLPFKDSIGELWPQGRPKSSLILLSIVIGYVLGTTIGDAYCGCSTWALIWLAPGRFAAYLLLTACVGAVITYFYFSRGRAQLQQAQLMTAQRDIAEARLKLLQSQLEPHMLFNTLASLRLLIPIDPQRAVSMLDQLNRYLRATLGGSRQIWHPLSEEFARLRDYLELMSVRMGPRLRFDLDLPTALAAEPVPPLLLQALVENSIRHGLEPAVAGGEISVRAIRRADGQLQLEIIDTGVGLPEPYTVHPEVAASSDPRNTFGLSQVRARLQAAYGGRASFEISENRPLGTRARVILPPA